MEGILDAITHPEGLALFGTQLSQGQMQWLKKIAPREVVVILDGDAIGATMAIALVLVQSGFWKVSVVKLPLGKDPDQVRLEEYLQCREIIG